MTLKLPSSSTEFARSVTLAATTGQPELQSKIKQITNWRKQYQDVYREITRAEGSDKNAAFAIADSALKAIAEGIRDENGTSLSDLVKTAASSRDQVITIEIAGHGKSEAVSIAGEQGPFWSIAQRWVTQRVAEPGLIDAFKYLDENPNLAIDQDLLIALAGSAEFAPTSEWLRWGGKVAVVARPNPQRWLSLIAEARKSGGTLLVPVKRTSLQSNDHALTDEEISKLAGLDLVEDTGLIASWLMKLSTKSAERLVIGNYAYAPGSKQILAQAAQDALTNLMCEMLPKKRLAIAWLGTPLDSFNLDPELNKSNFENYISRSPIAKLRDLFFKPFGLLQKPTSDPSLFDATSNRQGPSYILSKRSERWRAMVADRQGITVSFAIAPPARTRSVLNYKVLEATYRGGPSFGIFPFEVATAKSAMAALLLRNLHDPRAAGIADSPRTAVHGGTWRMAYFPDSVWIAATLLGFLRRG